MDSVLDIIKKLESATGSNKKLEILKENRHLVDLRQTFKMALDSMTSFHIRKIPEVTEHSGTISLSEAQEHLKKLSSREVTGNAGVVLLTNILGACSEDDAEVIRRIIGRDLRCGASSGTANKVWPSISPSFPVCLATSYSKKALAKIVYPAFAQLKADGARCEAIIHVNVPGYDDTVQFFSRNGKTLHFSEYLENQVINWANKVNLKGSWVLDGEMLYSDPVGDVVDRSTGNGIVNKAVAGSINYDEESKLKFALWDMIDYSEFQLGKGTEPYHQRYARLESLVRLLGDGGFLSVVPTHTVNNISEAQKLYQEYISDGLEGIILKNRMMLWEDSRSKDQVKFKQELVADLEILEILPGKAGKKYEEITGSVTMTSKCRQLIVNVSGMSDDTRKMLWKNRASVPGQIWEVTYNSIVKAKGSDVYKLFLPRLGIYRADKDDANTLEELQKAATEASL